MRIIKIVTIVVVVLVMIYFITYKSDKQIIEGHWTAEKIILNNQQLYPTEIDRFFNIGPEVIIDSWSRSILIQIGRDKLSANYVLGKDPNGNRRVQLSSKEKSLNGDFALHIDTIYSSPREYEITVKMQSDGTLIHFQRKVFIKPLKPEFPRRGQV